MKTTTRLICAISAMAFSLSALSSFASAPPVKTVDDEGATYSCNLTDDPSTRGVFIADAGMEYANTFPASAGQDIICVEPTLNAYRKAVANCRAAGFSKCGGPNTGGLIEIEQGGGALSIDVKNFYTLGGSSYQTCRMRVSVKGSN